MEGGKVAGPAGAGIEGDGPVAVVAAGRVDADRVGADPARLARMGRRQQVEQQEPDVGQDLDRDQNYGGGHASWPHGVSLL